MNKRIKKLWVDALRSGDYVQGKEQLRNSKNEFCCLGVLCNIHAQEHPERAKYQYDSTHYLGYEGLLPDEVEEWAELSSDAVVGIEHRCVPLYQHNDGDDGVEPKTFLQIADAIESQL